MQDRRNLCRHAIRLGVDCFPSAVSEDQGRNPPGNQNICGLSTVQTQWCWMSKNYWQVHTRYIHILDIATFGCLQLLKLACFKKLLVVYEGHFLISQQHHLVPRKKVLAEGEILAVKCCDTHLYTHTHIANGLTCISRFWWEFGLLWSQSTRRIDGWTPYHFPYEIGKFWAWIPMFNPM